ncbi:hypothetical protein D3C85_1059960 [compost metagenome]
MKLLFETVHNQHQRLLQRLLLHTLRLLQCILKLQIGSLLNANTNHSNVIYLMEHYQFEPEMKWQPDRNPLI